MAKFITTISCIDSLAAALNSSVDLAATVSLAFPGKTLKYWIGIDEMQKPQLVDAPLLVLMPSQFGRNAQRTEQVHGIQLALIIEQESTTNTGNITKHTALETVERLSRKIDECLETWIENNFQDGYAKSFFVPSLAIPAAKVVWTYEFSDQN